MKKANPALIGIFILGAIAIGIAALVFFGSAEVLKERVPLVTLFDQDVDGLQIGSKVKLKGIPVGEVKKILIRFQSEDGTESSQPSIPVIYDIDVAELSEHLGIEIDFANAELFERHIQQGLRARLETQSVLTGLLQVNLDYIEDAKVPGALKAFEYNGSSYQIIPAVKSDLLEAKQDLITAVANFSETDFKGISNRLSKLLETLTEKFELLKPGEINEAIAAIKDRINSKDIDEMLSSFADASAKLAAVAEKIDKQVGDDELASILKSTQNTMEAAEKAIETGEQTMRSISATSGNLESMTDQDAEFRKELERSVIAIGDAAKQINELAAYLSERPNAIIFGRKDGVDDERSEHPEKKRPLFGPRSKRR
jgi:paraquat-inducible protein B